MNQWDVDARMRTEYNSENVWAGANSGERGVTIRCEYCAGKRGSMSMFQYPKISHKYGIT